MIYIFGNLLEGLSELSMITAMIYYSNTAKTHSQISRGKKMEVVSGEIHAEVSYALHSHQEEITP